MKRTLRPHYLIRVMKNNKKVKYYHRQIKERIIADLQATKIDYDHLYLRVTYDNGAWNDCTVETSAQLYIWLTKFTEKELLNTGD